MRVFHGPQNIGGMAGVLARAQRELRQYLLIPIAVQQETSVIFQMV